MAIRYWSIIITYVICQLSGIIVYTPALNFIPKEQRSATWIVFSFLITLVISLFLLLPERHMHRDIERASIKDTVKWAIYGIFLVYLTQFVASMIDVGLLGEPPKSENTENVMNLVRSAPYAVLVVAIVGPILEEIIFRKIIFGYFYRKTNFWIAAIISALLFSLLHMDKHIIIYAGIGITLAFLYVKTRRIIVPIIGHCSMNTIAIVLTFTPSLQRLQDQQHDAFIHWLLVWH
ncbi:peptidase [Pullulanibacillus camelliae]|uniref:Peptidase n=1 Tax=Pullulanibacillus camelliae TaxID=1707096 RepID=A0A8J3E0X9_9BACL|nr:type II CAAX endopeptidase family protein [Pullulanibacillus camelliae]GGE55979.1 peptidase [Pullulanibacillus camelliae]